MCIGVNSLIQQTNSEENTPYVAVYMLRVYDYISYTHVLLQGVKLKHSYKDTHVNASIIIDENEHTYTCT